MASRTLPFRSVAKRSFEAPGPTGIGYAAPSATALMSIGPASCIPAQTLDQLGTRGGPEGSAWNSSIDCAKGRAKVWTSISSWCRS